MAGWTGSGRIRGFLHVCMPHIAWNLEILSRFKQGGGNILVPVGDPSPLRLVRILPLCLDALCQILINKMIPNCILSKEGYNTSCF